MSHFVWLAVAAVAAVAEVLSLGLITLWFVVGALVVPSRILRTFPTAS